MKILGEISLKSDIVLRLNWRSHQHSTQHGRFSNEHHRSPIQSLTGILTCPSASRNNCLTRCAHSLPSYAVWTRRLARMHRARPTSRRSHITASAQLGEEDEGGQSNKKPRLDKGTEIEEGKVAEEDEDSEPSDGEVISTYFILC